METLLGRRFCCLGEPLKTSPEVELMETMVFSLAAAKGDSKLLRKLN